MSAWQMWSDLAEAEELADRELFPAAFVVPPTKDARGISVLCGLDSTGKKPEARVYVSRKARRVEHAKNAKLDKQHTGLEALTLMVSAGLTTDGYSVAAARNSGGSQ